MQELKPCPFCGGKAGVKMHKFFAMSETYGAECMECEAKTYQFCITEQEAAAKWNRRTEVARIEYDREEIHENCTVHVLWNSETGESSIGWWRNDKPPEVIG